VAEYISNKGRFEDVRILEILPSTSPTVTYPFFKRWCPSHE